MKYIFHTALLLSTFMVIYNLWAMDKQKIVKTRYKKPTIFEGVKTSSKIKELLKQGHDPNVGPTLPLNTALELQDESLIRMCLEYGADPKLKLPQTTLPLKLCHKLKKSDKKFYTKIDKLFDTAHDNLMKGKIPEKAFWNKHEKNLYKAAKGNVIHLALMKKAIEQGADSNSYFAEPLVQAILSTEHSYDKISFIEWLLANNADPFRIGVSGLSASRLADSKLDEYERKKTELENDFHNAMRPNNVELLYELIYDLENTYEAQKAKLNEKQTLDTVKKYQLQLKQIEKEERDINAVQQLFATFKGFQ